MSKLKEIVESNQTTSGRIFDFVGGKIFTFFILIIGLGVVSVPAGLVASALSKAREIESGNAK